MDKVVILARVSTLAQEYDRQVNELTQYCSNVGWVVDAVFSNKISGTKTIEERPEIQEMIEYVKHNHIKRVVCLEISRLGRNTIEALKVIQILNQNGVSLFVKNYNLETLTPEGKINPVASLICTILIEIASLERQTIIERVSSGRNQFIKKCRQEGIKMGRPVGYTKTDDAYRQQYAKEISLLKKNLSLRNIKAITGTSVNTLQKLKKYI